MPDPNVSGSRRVLERLDPTAFKAAAYAKGWNLRQLAERWAMTPEAVYRLAANPERSPYLDDAVRGLPRVGRPRPVRPTWRRTPGPAEARGPEHVRRLGPGMRYHGYMVLGAVVAVAKDLGSVAEEGMRGVVIQISTMIQPSREIYRVIFETGELESFDADLVDEYLVTTGLERPGLAAYRYQGDDQVRADFESGSFEFHEQI